MKTIKLTDIKVGDRSRVDYGNIEELAESIRDNGLLQPIVLSEDGRLIAGGRRLRAHELLASAKVECEDPTYYESVPFVTFEEYLRSQNKLAEGEVISNAELRKLELEENVQRQAMSWQEYVISIYLYHRAANSLAVADGHKWSQQQTGKLLGLSQAKVSMGVTLGKELHSDKNRQSDLWECENFSDAIRLRARKKQDEAQAELIRRVKESAPAKPLPIEPRPEVNVTELLANLTEKPQQGAQVMDLLDEIPEGDVAKPVVHGEEVISYEDCLAFYTHGDAIEQLVKMAADGKTVDHIITDPPYGINMSNLADTPTITRIMDTHQVAPNIDLLQQFIIAAYNVVRPHGFLAFWYDLDHHNMLQDLAKLVGWKVCRWPFHWCKTSSCRNEAPQYNITKSVEHCMILRKSEESVLARKRSNNYVLCGASPTSTHPFFKPFEVWQPLFDCLTHEGQEILDPFAGEGSSLIAGLCLNRKVTGIENTAKHINNGVMNLYAILNNNH